MSRVRFAALILLLLFPAMAQASDLSRFNGAVARAYEHYRGAVFYLRTGNPAVAEMELESAQAIWSEEVKAFRAAPPDAFADDPVWTSTLDGIGARLTDAEASAAKGDAALAQEMLLPVRGELAALRARNNVRVFSDCIDAVSAAVDRLWRFRTDPADLADRDSANGLAAATAVATYHFRRCDAEAPPAISADPKFRRIVTDAITSLNHMWKAIDEKDQESVISILREIRSFEGMLWLQFG